MIKKKNLSQNDKKIWEDYTKNPSDIYDKDLKTLNDNQKSRFRFDLHGFSLDDANKKVKEIVLYCIENNFKELLLITGKGIHSTNEKDAYVSKNFGKLRYSIPEFIQSNEDLRNSIISINEAEKIDGGEGAVLIKLKDL